ncbi:MAG: HDIG domain-containing protein [Defluviitaleaceae bacterium]|nr:HDIG domain-containing protein [Defluviitaleaceae bacterium]
MKKISKFKLNWLLITISLLFTIASVTFGSYIQQGYSLNIGDVSPRTFIATHQVENRIATERLRSEARETGITIIIQDSEVEDLVRTKLEELFYSISVLRDSYLLKRQALLNLDSNIQLEEFNSDESSENVNNENENLFLENTIILEHKNLVLSVLENFPELSNIDSNYFDVLISTEQGLFNHFRLTIFEIFTTLMSRGVIENSPRLEEEIYSMLSMRAIPYPLNSIGFFILDNYIVPNNLIDEEATNTLREDRAASVEPVLFIQNQNIVNDGEIITEEIYHALLDLGYISEGYTINYIPLIGSTLLIITMFTIGLFYIHLFVPNLCKNKNQQILLFSLYIVLITSILFFRNLQHIFMPNLIFIMLIGMLISFRFSTVLNIIISIITFLVYDGNLSYLLYFFITGTVVSIVTRYTLERSKIIIFSLFVSFISGFVSFSLNLLLDRTFSILNLYNFGFSALSGFFSVVIAVGTLPLWESLFGVITPIKLMDLTNPSNPLLRKLSIEAPGTYHHSIIVANLAEAAAHDISADTIIARVGAFFHDIGKLRHPMFFIENQVGVNLHDQIYPIDSAEIIIDHVNYGKELADEYKLPLVLRDIIVQHHGTTVLKFFYDKEKTRMEEIDYENTKEVDINIFTYPGPIPQFKEAAIVMLSDTVEAAIRAMQQSSKNKIDINKKVKELINNKLMEGQLLDSGLTLKDIDMIEKAFIRVFSGMYHERIPYPVSKNDKYTDNKRNKSKSR